jgi:hypothetical protein
MCRTAWPGEARGVPPPRDMDRISTVVRGFAGVRRLEAGRTQAGYRADDPAGDPYANLLEIVRMLPWPGWTRESLRAQSVRADLDATYLGRMRIEAPQRRSACAWCPVMPLGRRQAEEVGSFLLSEPVALTTDKEEAAVVDQTVVDSGLQPACH